MDGQRLRFSLLPVIVIALFAQTAWSVDPPPPRPADVVRLKIPHSTRVGQKLYRNAPWLYGVDVKNVIDGHHEWFSLIKDKGDHHLQVNGYLHRLVGQVLQLELLHSETRELARLLQIYIAPPETAAEPPAHKYLASSLPPLPPSLPPLPPSQTQRAPEGVEDAPLLWRKRSDEQEFLTRFKRQVTSSRITLQVNENVAPGSFLFQLVNPNSPTESYLFRVPPPEELEMDPKTSNVYLRADKELSYFDKPSIFFTVIIQTADGRGIYRLQDYELQVQRVTVELNPIISRYATVAWTALYRGTETDRKSVV